MGFTGLSVAWGLAHALFATPTWAAEAIAAVSVLRTLAGRAQGELRALGAIKLERARLTGKPAPYKSSVLSPACNAAARMRASYVTT
jgi:hypothetical protein